jgi:hypothetical protein
MHGDGGIDQIATEASKARERPVLVGSREPAIADDICHQNRRELAVSLIAPFRPLTD